MNLYQKLLTLALLAFSSSIFVAHNIHDFTLGDPSSNPDCGFNPANPNEQAPCDDQPPADQSILENLPIFIMSYTIDDSHYAVSNGNYASCFIGIQGEFNYASHELEVRKAILKYLAHYTEGSYQFAGKYLLTKSVRNLLKYANDGDTFPIDCPSSLILPELVANFAGDVTEANGHSYQLYGDTDLLPGHNYPSHEKIYDAGAGPGPHNSSPTNNFPYGGGNPSSGGPNGGSNPSNPSNGGSNNNGWPNF